MSDQEDRVAVLVAMVRVLADQVDQAIIEADALRIAYPQGVVSAAAALDSWAGFLRRTYRP